jgi:hypothetical protein
LRGDASYVPSMRGDTTHGWGTRASLALGRTDNRKGKRRSPFGDDKQIVCSVLTVMDDAGLELNELRLGQSAGT